MYIYLPNKKDIHIIYILWLIHLCSRLCNNDTLKKKNLTCTTKKKNYEKHHFWQKMTDLKMITRCLLQRFYRWTHENWCESNQRLTSWWMYRMKHGNGMNNGWWEKMKGECQSMMQVILVGEMCYSSSVCRCTIQFNQQLQSCKPIQPVGFFWRSFNIRIWKW